MGFLGFLVFLWPIIFPVAIYYCLKEDPTKLPGMIAAMLAFIPLALAVPFLAVPISLLNIPLTIIESLYDLTHWWRYIPIFFSDILVSLGIM